MLVILRDAFMKSILLLCSIQYYVITSTIILIWVGIIIFIIYILRNTHQKVVLQILIRKWVLTNQRSELWFSHVKKMTRPIRIANDVFSRVRKTTRPIRSHRGVWVSRQNSRISLQLAKRRFAHIRGEKFFSKNFFSLKKWKTFQKLGGIVSFVSLPIKKTVESRRNNSGRGKTEQDVSLCCAFCRSYFVFHL